MTCVFIVSLMSLAIVAAEAIVAAVVRRYGMQFVRLSHSGWKIVTQSD